MPRAPFFRLALVQRLCLCAVMLALFCACTSSLPPPIDEMPPLPDLTISRDSGELAVELVDAARLQNVFKLTYEEMSDLYNIYLDAFDELVVYVPGLDGSDALFFGVLAAREDVTVAQQELDLLFEQLCESNPTLHFPDIVTRGRYILYISAAAPDPAFARLERALIWRA